DEVINQWREQVTEQNGEHDTFWIGWVSHTNHDRHEADEYAVYPLPCISHGGRHRICCHEYRTEGKATQHKVPVPWRRKHRVGVGTNHVEPQTEYVGTQARPCHDAL